MKLLRVANCILVFLCFALGCLMQLRGCGISETQHEFVEVIVEFGCVLVI